MKWGRLAAIAYFVFRTEETPREGQQSQTSAILALPGLQSRQIPAAHACSAWRSLRLHDAGRNLLRSSHANCTHSTNWWPARLKAKRSIEMRFECSASPGRRHSTTSVAQSGSSGDRLSSRRERIHPGQESALWLRFLPGIRGLVNRVERSRQCCERRKGCGRVVHRGDTYSHTEPPAHFWRLLAQTLSGKSQVHQNCGPCLSYLMNPPFPD